MSLVHHILLALICFIFIGDLIRYFYTIGFYSQQSLLLGRSFLLQGTSPIITRFYYTYVSFFIITLKVTALDSFWVGYRLGFLLLILLFWFLVFNKQFFQYSLWSVSGLLISSFFFCFIGCMYTLFYIRELISLLLVLELIAVLYYFFFLNYIDLKSFTLVKYKYLLGVYILMSYLVTLLFCLGMFGLSFLYGTLNYRELSYLTLNLNWACYLLLCAFFLKLGLPSLHFFKLELYQFINFNLLYLYSILSLLLTLYIYFFLRFFSDT